MFKILNYDLERILKEDPAAKSKIEVLLLYPCIHALIAYRASHFFYKHKMFFLARLISQMARFLTGIERDYLLTMEWVLLLEKQLK